jgi:murein DD-endopeptidase MepM/ murein hydrolase activator NlpD
MPMFRSILLAVLLAVMAWPAQALELSGSFTQGGLVVGRAEAGAKVLLDGRPVRVGDAGEFVIGFGREAKPSATLEVRYAGGRRETRRLDIGQRRYDIQRIDGLPPAQVTPPPEVMPRIHDEGARIAAARATDTPQAWFLSGWIWPADGPISGVYGSQRILNGEPRQPHYGLDIAGPTGTPVVASTDGKVLMAEKDLYFTGGTVIVDHGFGVTGVYSHLHSVDVAPGQMLRQGDRLGTIGATGRVSGPHLDWRLNWFDQRLDPALLLPPRQGDQQKINQ